MPNRSERRPFETITGLGRKGWPALTRSRPVLVYFVDKRMLQRSSGNHEQIFLSNTHNIL